MQSYNDETAGFCALRDFLLCILFGELLGHASIRTYPSFLSYLVGQDLLERSPVYILAVLVLGQSFVLVEHADIATAAFFGMGKELRA